MGSNKNLPLEIIAFNQPMKGLPIFVQGSPGPGVRAVIPSQIQMPRNVTTQEMGLI